MKTGLIAFQLQRRTSTASGGMQSWRMSSMARDQLGQFETLIVQLIGTQADAHAQVQVRLFTTPYDEIPPADVAGVSATWSGTAITGTLNGSPEVVAGPFAGNAELVLEITDSTSTGEVSWTGLVAVTGIIDG